jgi:hypothetical protein
MDDNATVHCLPSSILSLMLTREKRKEKKAYKNINDFDHKFLGQQNPTTFYMANQSSIFPK